MKIVHISYSDSAGGAAIGAYRLHRAMAHRGVDSQMLVLFKGSDDPTVRSVLNKENTVLFNEFAKATNEMRDLYGVEGLPIRTLNLLGLGISRAINNAKPDIVQLHWVANNTLKISELPKIDAPIVWKMPDMWAFSGGEHYNRRGDPDRWLLGYDKTKPFHGEAVDIDLLVWQHKRRYYQDLDLTITSPSRFLASCAHRSVLLRPYDCHVIPNPLPWTFIEGEPASAQERRDIRAGLGLPAGKVLVAFAAYSTQEKRKGYHHVEEMVEKHLPRHYAPDELDFVVIGAPGRARRKLGNFDVHLFPTTDDEGQYKTYLRACDLMMFPSEMDSTAMVVQEALAQGVPSIVFDVGGLPEMVVHKKNGFLARPYQPKDLADGLSWWKDLNEEARAGCRDFAARRSRAMHNPNLCVKRYLQLYESVIKRQVRGETFQTGAFVDVPDPQTDSGPPANRAFVIDPSAVTNVDSSHNTEHSLAFVASLYASFIPTTLVLNENATVRNPVGDTIKSLNWTIYDKIRALPQDSPPAGFADESDNSTAESFAIYDTLRNLAREYEWRESDVIIFPTTDRFCIEGLLMYLYAHSQALTPSFHLNIMFERADFLRGGYPLQELMAGLRASGYLDQRVFLYAETWQMAQDLARAHEIPVHRYPPPSVFTSEQLKGIAEACPIHDRSRETYAKCSAVLTAAQERAPDPSAERTIAVVGRGRRDKGWALLPEIISIFNRKYGAETATFVVQRPRAMDGLKDEERQVENLPNAVLFDPIVPALQLESMIKHAAVMLLPYDPNVYGNRGSAFAWKAVSHAVPMVVSQQTALTDALLPEQSTASDSVSGDELEQPVYLNGIGAQTAEEFADALYTVLANLDAYQAGAAQMRLRYFEESVRDTVIKKNMRAENYCSTGQHLLIRESGSEVAELPPRSNNGKQNGDFTAVLEVATEPTEGAAGMQPITSDGLHFAAAVDADNRLDVDALPDPLRRALHANRVSTISVPASIAVNYGALRGWPAHLLARIELYDS